MKHLEFNLLMNYLIKELSSLIAEFNKLKKIPLLLNTSFNENEPIVRKPEEALNCILRNDLEY